MDNLQLAARHEDALLVIDDGLTALKKRQPELPTLHQFVRLRSTQSSFDLLEFLLTHHYQSEILYFLPARNDARYIERIERFKP